MSASGGRYSFVPVQHEVNYQPMSTAHPDEQRSASPSSAKNKFWPFNRSRSSSPNNQVLADSHSPARSRKSSSNSHGRRASPNASGFVVRTVTRQPGGVSGTATSTADARYQPDWNRVTTPSPRRMALEDSDDDNGPVAANGEHQLQYRRSKSRPVSSALSLSVPAGGPGGGVGYGTSRSSNDGRPEPFGSPSSNHPQPTMPRPSSPGGSSMTAGGFQKSLQDRGRSPRKVASANSLTSQTHTEGRSRSRSVQSGEGVVLPSGKVIRPMITPGPKSLAQHCTEADEAESHRPTLSGKTSFQSIRPQSIAGPRQFPGPARPPAEGEAPVSPIDPAAFARHPSPLGFPPRSGADTSAGTMAVTSSDATQQGRRAPMRDPTSANRLAFPTDQTPSPDSASPHRDGRFSFGFARGRKASEVAADLSGPVNASAAAGPLQGLPSPVDIPYGRSPGSGSALRSRSRDPGAETDYSYENGASPFGSVSPAGSPGFHTAMASRGEGAAAAQSRSGSPGGPVLASKWFKGMFGKSPRADESDQDWLGAPNYPNANQPPNRQGSPLPDLPSSEHPRDHQQTQQGPQQRQALMPRQPSNQGRRSQTLPNPPSEDDVEALLQKRESMKQARKIVDAQRRQVLSASVQRGFDPDQDREFRPKQIVDASEDYQADFEAMRRKSPPGRKPAPRLSDAVARLDMSASEEQMTPAQRIIHETRSMHLARESLERQNGSPRSNHAAAAPVKGRASNVGQSGSGHSDPDQLPQPGSIAEAPPAQHQQLDQAEVAVRRKGAGSGKGKGRAASSDAPTSHPAPSRQQQQQQQPHRDVGARQLAAGLADQTHSKVGSTQRAAGSALSPGSGPMPIDMTLPQALQEMMVRFYRFERYSVPLIRSLETRLLDIERDAMMAFNPQSGARANVETASQHDEMDRWVGQMTKLMKHEVGQLKAAAKEIREGRELVAQVAKGLGGAVGGGIGGSSSLPSFSSIGTLPSANTAALTTVARVADKGVFDSPGSTEGDTGIHPPAAKRPAIQVKTTILPDSAAPATRRGAAETSDKFNVSSSTLQSGAPTAREAAGWNNLSLPPGSKPALDKDEGKFGSPTKATFGFHEGSPSQTSGSREGSSSPNGRPRYTTALGQPMQGGRISPGASSPVREWPDAITKAGIASPGRWSEDQRKFGQALVASPAVSDRASIHSAISGQSEVDRPKREISVEERLKALMDGRSTRSRASSLAVSLAGQGPYDEAQPEATDASRLGKEPRSEIAGVDSPDPQDQSMDPHPTEPLNFTSDGTIKRRPGDQGGAVASPSNLDSRRQLNASLATTATSSTGARTIRPGGLPIVANDAAPSSAPRETADRPLAVKRSTGDIAKRASTYLEVGNGTTAQQTSSDPALPTDGRTSPTGSPTTRPAASPSAAEADRSISPPAPIRDIFAEVTRVKTTPSPSVSASVRQRALSYLSTAGAGSEGASEAPSPSRTSTSAKPYTDDETLAEMPSKMVSPASWLASSSSPSKARSYHAPLPSTGAGSATGSTSNGLQSGRISPSKLHANRFASTTDKGVQSASSSPLVGSSKGVAGPSNASGTASKGTLKGPSRSRQMKEGSSASISSSSATKVGTTDGVLVGGVEKKRSMPVVATATLATGGGTPGAKGPMMVGHAATLKERVAFFDSVK